ncbi:MAG: hypothetical protein AB8H86_22325 [Polyangiales bacterium]
MRLLMLVLCLAMLGCFRTIDSTPSGPGVPTPGPTPRRFDAGPFTDLGPWESDSPGFRDAGFPDAGFFDGAAPDAWGCPQCEVDSDCPEPPPGGCAQALCVAGVCNVGAGDCGVDAACDQEGLFCTPEALELRTTLRTDYEPFVEFDRAVLRVNDTVVHQDAELAGDPLEGILLGPVLVGVRDELRLDVTLYQGCNELVSRSLVIAPDGSPSSQTVIITRELGP